jgi:pilus assembly protein Flp/PilA
MADAIEQVRVGLVDRSDLEQDLVQDRPAAAQDTITQLATGRRQPDASDASIGLALGGDHQVASCESPNHSARRGEFRADARRDLADGRAFGGFAHDHEHPPLREGEFDPIQGDRSSRHRDGPVGDRLEAIARRPSRGPWWAHAVNDHDVQVDTKVPVVADVRGMSIGRRTPHRAWREPTLSIIGSIGQEIVMALVSRVLAALRHDDHGQGLAEYALILALIAIVAIIALIFLGGQVSTILSTVGNSV